MDRGSLRALRVFTNVGYTLGFLPYKFQVLPHDQQVEDANSAEKDGENVVKREYKKCQGLCSSLIKTAYYVGRKIKIVGGRMQLRLGTAANNEFSNSEEENEDVDIRWKFLEGSRGRWWIFIWSMSLQFMYECFLIFRSVEMFLDDEAPSKNKMPVYYLTVTLMILQAFQVILVKEYEQLHGYLNAVRDTVAHIRNNEPVNGGGEPGNQRSIKVFGYSALALGIFVPLARSSDVFLNPGSKLVVTSLAEDPTNLPLWLRVVAAAFHFHVAGFSTFVSWFLGLTLPWYVASILLVIEQRRPDVSTQDFIYKSYNMLSILQMHFSQVYGNVALVMEIGCVYIIVFNIFLAVVHRSVPGLIRTLIVYHLQNNFFSRLGEIHTASVAAMETWKEQNNDNDNDNGRNHWFTKFHRSVRPLRIYIGSFFFVDNSFILTLASINLDQSVNLILSYR